MQTQCPHCDTKFRVTQIQVEAADGYLRCGICKEVFNAIEVVNQHEHQQPLLDEAARDTQTGNQEEIQPTSLSEENEDSNTFEFSDELTPDATQRGKTHSSSNDAYDDVSNDNPDDTADADTLDLFDEDSNESLQHVVPEKFRDGHSVKSSSGSSTALWILGSLFLTATLIVEYVWFNRNQFNHIPELQAALNQLCQQIECKSIGLRDPKRIELISRNVYSHPNEKGALMINVTMKNNAKFAQPYPVMQVDFSDVRGGIVAARRFLPAEYVKSPSQKLPLIAPNTNASITLEIIDPGSQALTYEFNFL